VREPVDVAELLKSALRDAQITYPKQQIRFSEESADSDLLVTADSDQLRQVLNNLISNADRFNPTGQPIELKLDAGADKLLIRVVDHGEGIPDAVKERVFERFFRSDSSRARDTGGSGLGLAIAKAIVDSHSGRIWVEDTSGGGATFVVELPRTRV
jgi:two-component system OmpR family sensor kinase